MCLDVSDPKNLVPIANSIDWRCAVDDLLVFWAGENRCYSSGEVTAALRLHRSDLSFAVTNLGSYLRDKFYNNTLPQYADDGQGNGPCSPVQRCRFTQGRFPNRVPPTPANTEVFVYGPDVDACDAHEFEIFVPKWDWQKSRMETMADAPAPTVTTPSSAVAPGSKQHAKAVTAIYGAKPGVDAYTANVWVDKGQASPRMCIGRPAFECLCYKSGTPIRAGQPVYVKVEPGVKAVVTITDPGNGAKPYSLVKDKNCIAFPSSDAAQPFPGGTSYSMVVTATEMTVDLTKVL